MTVFAWRAILMSERLVGGKGVGLFRGLIVLLRLGRLSRIGSGSRFGDAGVLPNEKRDEGNRHEGTEDAEGVECHGVALRRLFLSKDSTSFANIDGVGKSCIGIVRQRDAWQMKRGRLC